VAVGFAKKVPSCRMGLVNVFRDNILVESTTTIRRSFHLGRLSRSAFPHYDQPNSQALKDRLAKVEGQVRGIGRMVDAQRPPHEVLQQLASIRSAIKGLMKVVLQNYLEKCAADAVRSGDRVVIDEMLETLIKFIKE
jgi:CsoR family transcriptional regulator, copper-sensing transcriptional repressor